MFLREAIGNNSAYYTLTGIYPISNKQDANFLNSALP